MVFDSLSEACFLLSLLARSPQRGPHASTLVVAIADHKSTALMSLYHGSAPPCVDDRNPSNSDFLVNTPGDSTPAKVKPNNPSYNIG